MILYASVYVYIIYIYMYTHVYVWFAVLLRCTAGPFRGVAKRSPRSDEGGELT